MEFWGVEVKPGETVKCEPGEEKLLHITKAALGETKKKGDESVPIYVKFNDQKLVLGTLSSEKCAQISYDLLFEKDFELSHSSKNASVYFCGYKSEIPDDEYPSSGDEFEFSSDEDVPNALNDFDKPKVKAHEEKPTTVKSNADKKDNAVAKPKAKTVGPIKAEPKAEDEDDEDEDSEGSDDDDMMEAMGDSDDDGIDDEDSDDDEDDESSEEDEATPKKSANGKKRPAESSALKTPVPEKKAKLVTPAAGQKTGGDGKKSAHVATPHPAKQVGKTPANNDKSKQQTPKSAGSVTCNSCSKSFNSEKALESHTKAKHSAAK